uniref:Uncharacterized protein n=1 Tax=Rhizophora mucronata TaxID=61149 RepID=A0A2P2MLZ0_RHIMU
MGFFSYIVSTRLRG